MMNWKKRQYNQHKNYLETNLLLNRRMRKQQNYSNRLEIYKINYHNYKLKLIDINLIFREYNLIYRECKMKINN